MPSTVEKINALQKPIEKAIALQMGKLYGEIDDYEIAWRQLQKIATQVIVVLVQKALPNAIITIPSSKSTYPDIKIETEEGLFAIDIKANEAQKNPWFDMARLDTIFKERILKYKEEWELVIKYDSRTKVFLEAYFLLFREAVGYRAECKGVKYRPYDGKIRPKTWADFTNKKVYWNSKKEFLEGIQNSFIHRWKKNLKEILIPQLTPEQKATFRELFD